VPGQWTLAVEMIFYLMVPILFIKIKKISQAIIAFLILFSISWILIISFADQSLINNSRLWGLYMHRSPLAQFHFFFLGIILYFLITKDYIKNNFIYIRNILVLSILWSATLGLLAKIITSDFHTFYHVMILIESLIIFLWVMYLLRYKWKFFINSIINYIGKISYSIYLTHFILLNFLIEKMGSIYSLHGATINMTIWYWTLYIIYFSCGTIALASITYYWIEVPWQWLGKSIISTLSKKNHKSLSI
jgi:peptidoglycan/LPS O-acetylase OafA/YrhL